MFYFKKIDGNSPNVDTLKEHSTLELHIMTANNTTECSTCNKEFKDGEECQVYSKGSKMLVTHRYCPL